MSHTPGPWFARRPEEDELWEIYADCGDLVTYPVFTRNEEHNIHLIAAAPDLLAACEELLIYLGDWDDPGNETCVRARAAIARAKGDADA